MLHGSIQENIWPLIRTIFQENVFGYPLLVLVMILQVILPPIPAEIIIIGAANIYGVLLTGFLAGTGLFLGSVIVYYFGMHIREEFNRFFSKRKLQQTLGKLHKHESLILWIRILPYNPSDIISYAAGIMEIEKRKYYAITAVACYARCFILAWLGSVLKSISSILAAVGILAVSAILACGFLYGRKE